MVRPHTVPTTERMTTVAGIRAVLHYAASRGLDVNALCSSLGLDQADFEIPLRMIPFTLTKRVWLAVIEQFPEDNIGVGLATMFRTEQVGYVGLLLSQARNGLELLQLMVDAGPLTDTALVDDPVTLVRRGDHVEVHLPAVLHAGIPERTEAAFVSMLASLQRLGVTGLRPIHVRAAHDWSEKRAVAAAYYGCKVTWNAGRDVMCLERRPLLCPLAGSHPRAADQFRALVASEVEKRTALPFPERVRRAIRHHLHRGDTSQKAAASALGISTRTLQRKLTECGSSFANVREELIAEWAEQLLRDDTYTIEQIALKLGYSELRSFSRLWRRLRGETPGRYRARLRATG